MALETVSYNWKRSAHLWRSARLSFAALSAVSVRPGCGKDFPFAARAGRAKDGIMKNRKLLTVLLASLLLGACAAIPADGGYRHEPVRVAPPPPYVEYIGPPPVIGHVWISGYWNWGGVRYVWVPGYWVPPRHGYHWVPHRWDRHGDHWRRKDGHWEHGGPPHHQQPGHKPSRPGAGGHSRFDHDEQPRPVDIGKRSAFPVRPMAASDANERPRGERPQGSADGLARQHGAAGLPVDRVSGPARIPEQRDLRPMPERNRADDAHGPRRQNNRDIQRGIERNGRGRQD